MLNTALVGTGRWGAKLVGCVNGISEKIRFVAAATTRPDAQGQFRDRFDIPIVTFDKVLADPQVDAILIATPHSLHHDQVLAAAAARKHVFVEKPLALTRSDAESAIAACRQAGVKIGHGFNRRFSPAFREIETRLRRGDLGDLLYVEGQFSGPSGFMLRPGMWRAERSESPGGAMTARGVHALDCLVHFAGPVAEVFAHSRRRKLDVDVDDTTSALLDFQSGVTGTIASHHATSEIWRVQLYGSEGWIEMRSETDLVFRPVDGESESIVLEASDMERAELECFADHVSGSATYPVTDAEAVNVIAVVEAIHASSKTRQPVQIS